MHYENSLSFALAQDENDPLQSGLILRRFFSHRLRTFNVPIMVFLNCILLSPFFFAFSAEAGGVYAGDTGRGNFTVMLLSGTGSNVNLLINEIGKCRARPTR